MRSSGTWYFIVAWQDHTAQTCNLQVNNSTVYSASYAGGPGIVAMSNPFFLGRSASYENQYFDGRIAEVGFWHRDLSSAEISDLYNGGHGKKFGDLLPGEKTSLISWWDLSETNGTRYDSMGVNNLTDNGGVTAAAGVR